MAPASNDPPVSSPIIGVIPRQQVQVALAIIFNATGQLLICKRKPDSVLPGFWEFPGGKCLPHESPADCAVRETLEETALTIQLLKPLPPIDHHYPHAHVRLHPFLCQYTAGTLQLLAVAEALWISPAQVTQYRFPEANTPLLAQVALGLNALLAATQ